MSLFDRGDERFKAGVHGLALALSGAAAIVHLELAYYNARVWRRRGTAWHLTSALVYAAVVGLEVVHVARHLTAAKDEAR